jgi:hypothetical protein
VGVAGHRGRNLGDRDDNGATLRGYFSYIASKTGVVGLMRASALAQAGEQTRDRSARSVS